MNITGTTAHYELVEGYKLHIGVHDTRLGKHLTIDTQWLGAKDPSGLQRQYSVTVSPQTLERIAQHILDEARRQA